MAHAQKGKFDTALRDYSKAAEIDSGYAEVYFDKAIAYQSLERHQEALKALRTFVELTGPKLSSKVREAETLIEQLETR